MKLKIVVLLVLVTEMLLLNSATELNKILITGGAGFIGSHLGEALLARGEHVVVVDNMNDYYDVRLKEHNLAILKKRAIPGQFTFYKVDICDKEALKEVFEVERPAIICHLAARAGVRSSMEQPKEYIDTNIIGTLYVLEMARNYGIKKIVFASSSSVYGASSVLPFTETDPADRPMSVYAATKRSDELIMYTYHHIYKLPVACLRFFTVYGPRGRPDMAPFKFLDAIYNDKPITQYGDGNSIRDFTYIDDIVAGIVKVIDIDYQFEIFNMGTHSTIKLRDFIKLIEDTVQKKAIINIVPFNTSDMQATQANITKIEQKLGYTATTSIQEGIRKLYEWYCSEYLTLIKN